MIHSLNLKKNYQNSKKEIDLAIDLVLQSGKYILSENVSCFEKEFAQYLKVKYAVGVANGTDALILALRALGVNQDDEIIIPANSYPTAFAAAEVSRRIKLVDIDSQTLNIDPEKIEEKISKRTKVIIPVHLYGLISPMEEISRITKKHHLYLISDAAQAHGASLNGQKAGTISDLGCFSFYPTKNLGCFGDGGMVTTNNKRWAEKIRMLRMYGEKKRYQSLILGTNSRLDEIQAAILRVKLKSLDKLNQRRITIAKKYFKSLKNEKQIILPPLKSNLSHVYHQFVIQTPKRDALRDFLLKNGVETLPHYPLPIHLVKAFQFLDYKKGDFPKAEKAAGEIISLPCYPELSLKEVEKICSLVKKFFKR